MRWLYHVARREAVAGGIGASYAPPSLAAEGFLHASYQPAVAESARLYFPADAELAVLQIDPRRLDVDVDVAATPRGAMPHVQGAIPADAVRRVLTVADVAAGGDTAPDRVVGTRVAFVAFDGMTLLDLLGALDPVSRIASMGFDRTAEIAVVAASAAAGPGDREGGVVWAAGGARFVVDRAASGAVRPVLDPFDVVVVPGGGAARTLARDPEVVAWLATWPKNRLTASACTGALLLGAAGFLRGRRATTHASAVADLAAFGALAPSSPSARVVTDGPLLTAGGVTSAIDLGIALVRRLEGDAVAAAIATQMAYAV